jgi:hypothetical protein
MMDFSSIQRPSSIMTLLPLLSCPKLSDRFFNPSTFSPASSNEEVIPGTDKENVLALPLGRSLKLGALGLGLFLARPPT